MNTTHDQLKLLNPEKSKTKFKNHKTQKTHFRTRFAPSNFFPKNHLSHNYNPSCSYNFIQKKIRNVQNKIFSHKHFSQFYILTPLQPHRKNQKKNHALVFNKT